MWKSPRRKELIGENSGAEIADALRLSLVAESDRAAVAVLLGLRGVGVPMASAILTSIDQQSFTVIDINALFALGKSKAILTVDYYLHYLSFCRDHFRGYANSLRDFDRALWKWGRENR